MKYAASLLILCTVLTISGPATALSAHAPDARFTQKILPLNCVFDEVNDGLGTLTYLTPAECGQIITPIVTPGKPNQNGQPSTITPKPVLIFQSTFRSVTPQYTRSIGLQPEPLPPNTPQSGLLLNTVGNITSKSGAIVTVKRGDALYYRPLGSSQATVRKIIVTGITTHSVTFSVWPLNQQANLELNKEISFDSTEIDPSPAIKITLERIVASSEPQVTLRLQLLRVISSAVKTGTVSRSDTQKIVLLSLGIIALLSSLSYGYIGQRRK